VPRGLGVLPQAPLHGVPTYHRLVIVALFAGPAGGCRSKALHAAEGNALRCYAGSLLRLPDHRPLGTRCLIDRRPRTFPAAAQRVPDRLAALVSPAIALRLTGLPQPRAAPSSGRKPAPSGKTSCANSPPGCATASPATASRFPYPPSCWPRSNAACSTCRRGLPSGNANALYFEQSTFTFRPWLLQKSVWAIDFLKSGFARVRVGASEQRHCLLTRLLTASGG
jgi:hypothetical protein